MEHLSTVQRAEHLEDARDLAAGGRLRVGYEPGPGVLAELTELAAAEQACCSFVTWSVVEAEGSPVLVVEAPDDAPEAVAPIAVLFGVAASA